ncbi:hypothetical protein MTR67_013619 [Solanum verrucosum]|uniref:Reverse transcriptase Ty1/copia-type domain-containing protein n=1 Tax=Solanum verrucosum TaxID=315347 RepID=A0AAF0QAS2_SOLVR|nr:hypothetical protein MTR67_013619 [Solanum verrucosum]
MDKCYRLHVFPSYFKFTKNKKSANCVQVDQSTENTQSSDQHPIESTPHEFFKDQYAHLMSLFNQAHISPQSPHVANFVGPSLKRPLEIGRAEHGLYILHLPHVVPASTIVSLTDVTTSHYSDRLSSSNSVIDSIHETMSKKFQALVLNLTWDIIPLPSGKNAIPYINNAFLHGDLSEEVFMKIPSGLTVSAPSTSSASLICRLNKSFDGLKQASRQWFAKLSHALISRGYLSSLNDYSLFTKCSTSSTVVIVVYVDDILLSGDDLHELTSLKAFLDDQFKIKDLGDVHYFLGLEVSRSFCGFLINQHKYTKELFLEFYCSESTSVVSPLTLNLKLTANSRVLLVDHSHFRRLVGKLNFLQHTRLNIYFYVQHLSQFLNAPRSSTCMLPYMSFSTLYSILLNSTPNFSMVAYSDFDWVACPSSRRFVTGFFISLGGSPISWKSKKQLTVSLSSVKAEYRALKKTVVELTCLFDCSLILAYPLHFMYLFIVTTKLPCVLLETLPCMSAPSILNLIAIFSDRNLLMVCCLFHMSTLLLNWLTFFPSPYLVHNTGFSCASWKFTHPPA